MITMNIHEAKTHFSKLIARVHQGEEVIIAKAGQPYAKIIPLQAIKRKPGIANGQVTESFFEPLAEEILADWEN